MAYSVDQDLIRHVSNRNNLSLRLEQQVTDRRGAKVLKLVGGEKHFGLKVATGSGTSLVHEAAILRELRQFTHHLYVDSGNYEGHSWTLQIWLDAQSVYRYVRQLRDGSEDDVRPKLVTLFATMVSKVADLHALGYLHGDLQPDHFKVKDDMTLYLLDFALTRRTDEPSNYGGALVHFSAPEICEQQRSGRSPVVYDAQAELYSLASVVFFLYTGRVSPDYGEGGMKTLGLEQKRECIAQGQRNHFGNSDCEPFDALEHVLERCLAVSKQARYSSAKEAARALYALRATFD